jgi:hypothetical protein
LKSRTLYLGAVLSAVVCLISAVLFVRSHWTADVGMVVIRGRQYMIASRRGSVILDNRPSLFDDAREEYGSATTRPARNRVRLELPYPYVIGASAVAFLLFVIRARPSRTERGLCPQCGYDLRATPQRCPECGLKRRMPAPAPIGAEHRSRRPSVSEGGGEERRNLA